MESGKENVLLKGLERAVVSGRGLAGLLLIPACVSFLINSLLKWHFPQEEVLEFRAEGTGPDSAEQFYNPPVRKERLRKLLPLRETKELGHIPAATRRLWLLLPSACEAFAENLGYTGCCAEQQRGVGWGDSKNHT